MRVQKHEKIMKGSNKMKKDELMKIEGMTDAIADAVVKASGEELKNYIPKTRFDEVNEAKKNAEALIKERDKQLETLKSASGDTEALKKQIEDLQADNKKAKSEYEASIKAMQVDNAVISAINAAGGKNVTAIKALLKDLDKAEISEDGTVKGLDEQIKSLVKSDAYLFESKGNTKPAGTTPAGGNENKPGAGSKPDFSKMTYDELTAYMDANPDVQ